MSFFFKSIKKTYLKQKQLIHKKRIWGLFWALFSQISAKMNFPGKKCYQFLYIQIIYHHEKNQTKPMSQS